MNRKDGWLGFNSLTDTAYKYTKDD